MQSTLVIISGPVASGKSTIITELLKKHPDWAEVHSFTTRQPRPNETVRNKYIYVSEEEFKSRVELGDIIEHEEYAGNLYGTSRSSLERALNEAPVAVIDLQTKGKEFVKREYPEAVDIYLYVPEDEIERRLKADPSRVNTGQKQLQQRLERAKAQNRARHSYSHVVENKPNQIPQVVAAVERLIVKWVSRSHVFLGVLFRPF